MGINFQQDPADEGGGMLADINVTPLVDVMLVLLIIFMVTAPLLQQGMSVELPKTSSESMPGDKTTMVVSVTEDGKIYMLKTEVSRDELKTKLAAVAQANPDKEVFLKADARVAYGDVAAVMGIIREAGISRLGIVTQPGEDEDR